MWPSWIRSKPAKEGWETRAVEAGSLRSFSKYGESGRAPWPGHCPGRAALGILGQRGLGWEAEPSHLYPQLCQPRVIKESGEVGCPLLSFLTAQESTELTIGGRCAPHCAGVWTETPGAPSLSAQPPSSPASLRLCAGQGQGAPRTPPDPLKFSSALGARLSGGLGKGIGVFPAPLPPGEAGAEMNCPWGAGPGGVAGSEVPGLGGGLCRPPPWGPRRAAPRSPGRAGGFQPGRPSAAVASPDVEERSPAAGARRPLLFI